MIITKSTTVAFTGYRASKILAQGQDPKDLQTQIIISQTSTKESYLKRNDYMLENSSHIIAYYDGKSGGTMYTINRAIKQGHKITNLLK